MLVLIKWNKKNFETFELFEAFETFELFEDFEAFWGVCSFWTFESFEPLEVFDPFEPFKSFVPFQLFLLFTGGWWLEKCNQSNLNGLNLRSEASKEVGLGMNVLSARGRLIKWNTSPKVQYFKNPIYFEN